MKKKIISILTILFVLFTSTCLSATSSTSDVREYTIESYDVNVIVNENNTFNITEKIDAYFNSPRHGIYRKIPLKNQIVRNEEAKSNNRAKITDIKVNDNYTLSNESGNRVIKIGDSNKTITGNKNYTISYVYNIGKDTGKNYDELYFNLIGNEWDTTISNITFTIKMPKSFDKSKLGFSKGVKNSTESKNIFYSVDGNVIKGYYEGTLNVGEGLTVRMELPEGYFVNTSNNFDLIMLLSLITPIIFVVICFILWKKYGKDNEVIETVEFYPPEGFNSAETGFLYKGKADNNDVISLLIYLANKGYIKISEISEGSSFLISNIFKITKIKEYDGNNKNEKIFLDGLFNKKNSASGFEILKNIQSKDQNIDNSVQEVTTADLYNNFYTVIDMIKSNINSKENKYRIFEKSSLKKGFLVILMILITFILITVKPVIEYRSAYDLIFAILFPAIGFSVLFITVFGKAPISQKLFGLVWCFGFAAKPLISIVLPALLVDPIYLITYIVGLICILAMILLFKLMPKRTQFGNQILGKIQGFKNFLEIAEKPKLEELVMQDPEYFYNILPYTYVLGVSDKWINKFETIAMKAPTWYDGYDENFNAARFGVLMGSMMSSAQSAMVSRPSSSSSSGSGGGSSGGGSGGGGGGSW